MADEQKKRNKQKSFEESIIKDRPGSFMFIVKYYIINFVGLMIVFPLVDLVICVISQKEFQYNVISYIASPAIWAAILLIFEIIWQKTTTKKK